MTRLSKALIVFIITTICLPLFVKAQASGPISWQFKVHARHENEILFEAIARPASGWRIYSQHIQTGGPPPTTFYFTPKDTYSLTGPLEEKGKPSESFDELYEMTIAWYSQEVMFSQRLRVREATVIEGRVEYVSCNSQVCISGTQHFTVPAQP